jgi:glycosyltransferase involved in cell wall biosynthesis
MRSVVLATYQGGQFIDAQLESIARQLAADDEIIVSDDGSSDETISTVLNRRDPRIRVLSNTSRVGYVKNFERAIASARGQHIFFSDQDDIWLPKKVEALTAALDRKPCVASDAIVVDTHLRELYPSFFAWRKTVSFSFWAVFLKPCIVGATLACRKSYLDTLLPFPPGVPHDFWITLNASWESNLEVISDPLILYRRHPSALSVSATSQKRRLDTILRERARIAVAMFRHRIGRRATGSGRD